MDSATIPAPSSSSEWPFDLVADEIVALGGGMCVVREHASKTWASVTFSGERHFLTVAFEGSEGADFGERFVACLPEHEFSIPRYLVADAAVVGIELQRQPPALFVRVEMLLISEGTA